MSSVVRVRLGTRRSKLALAQAREVAALLAPFGVHVELVPIITSGDRGAGGGLPQAAPGPAGLKGSFVHEIVTALLDGTIDLAVHSAKDLPAGDPDGVSVAAVPERADPRDVLIRRSAAEAPTLNDGARVGTSSLRRRAQLLRMRPGSDVVEVRGNVDTRLRKLEDGEVDALVLAAAGLERLAIRPPHMAPFDVDEMVPAPGQGALAVQVRTDDAAVSELVKQLDHPTSRLAFEAERRVMVLLEGGCALPLGAFARVDEGGLISLRAVVIRPDGSEMVDARAEGPAPAVVADSVVASLLAAGASAILDEVGA